ncbi:MAG: PepSY domain-containing protein [Tannerellaceae bacterium]|jgi:uncharacterized iron-regulated membrane protein|nr:PepSY domain-containing protein [Tannerellaceae bacterium]
MNSNVRRISLKLHLWIALLPGWVVFVVCITGALYAFKDEITALSEPWRFVKAEGKPVLYPSSVVEVATKEVSQAKPTAITYGRATDAVFVDYYDPKTGMTTVFINPYDGQIIKTVKKGKNDFDFFRFVLNGHRTLWLPAKIGRPIVGWSVLLFAIGLMTGIILWIPAQWKYLKNNFSIRRKRLTYTLHNTLGGLFVPFLLLATFTGLIWSFNWFSKAVYTMTGGGDLKPYVLPKSDPLTVAEQLSNPLDKLYIQLREADPQAPTFYFSLPADSSGVFRVSIEHKRNSYYRTDNLFFDQYTLKPLHGQGPYAGKYTEVSTADKIRRMNLEIHDGRILGIFGKCIAFCSSLVGASLSVTGFILWRKRTFRNKERRQINSSDSKRKTNNR